MVRVDGRAQKPLQAVPGCENLSQGALADDTTFAIDGDSPRYFDAEIVRAGAALFQCFQ
jgi:hypothetical protein